MSSVDNATLSRDNAQKVIEEAYKTTTGWKIPSSRESKIIIDKTFEHLDQCYICQNAITLASGLNEKIIKEAVAQIWGPLDFGHHGDCVIA